MQIVLGHSYSVSNRDLALFGYFPSDLSYDERRTVLIGPARDYLHRYFVRVNYLEEQMKRLEQRLRHVELTY